MRTTQREMQQFLQARGEFPVTDPAKREAIAAGIIVGLDGEELIVSERSLLYSMILEAGELHRFMGTEVIL